MTTQLNKKTFCVILRTICDIIEAEILKILSMVFDIQPVCSNHTTLELQETRIQNRQFTAYIPDTPVTLKQRQCHQTYTECRPQTRL